MPSRRHCRQTGPIYLAKFPSPYLSYSGAVYSHGRPSSRFTTAPRAPIGALSGFYTLRFLGGRHPLCGIGVTSLMARTSIPAVLNARTADSRPEPGPETRPSTTRSPLSVALLAAVIAPRLAANREPLRDPREP